MTRMSMDQKQNVITKNVEEERAQLEALLQKRLSDKKSSSSSSEEEELSSDSETEKETEKQNEINKKTTINNTTRTQVRSFAIVYDRNKLNPSNAKGTLG